MSRQTKNKPLEIAVRDGVLVISIGIETLAFCAIHSPEGDRLVTDPETGLPDESRLKIPDAAAFAKEIIMALTREEEDGTNDLHRLFDKAFIDAMDDGATSVDYVDWR